VRPDPLILALDPLGVDPTAHERGSQALRDRLERIRDNTYDLTRGGLGGGGLSLLPLLRKGAGR
jgi:hypothetical protein